jgi:acetyl esterase/lipase
MLLQVSTNAAKLSADPAKGFVVMGQSSGGQITAVLAQRARADTFFATYPLTGQILQAPLLCPPAGGSEGYYPAQYARTVYYRE